MTKLVAYYVGDGRTVYRFDNFDKAVAKRASLSAPYIGSDTMEPTQSMVDGKFYTSKAKLRATYLPSGNAEGKRYIEVGNDPRRFDLKAKTKPDKAGIREALKKAIAKASA